jgi:RNA polymerase sigma factor (sigma-70 family)
MPERQLKRHYLRQIFEQWNTPLKRLFARRLPRHIDPEDLAQETYLRLLRVKDLEAIEQPQAYLYHVARNIAAEWYSRSKRDQPLSQGELDALVELTTPEILASDSAEDREFEAALRDLPVAVRATIYLKLRDGKTHDEIAKHLGTSTRMVRKHLTVGYAALRRRLVKE